ncbi:MAG: TolC family protein [Bacteroidota bacterium]
MRKSALIVVLISISSVSLAQRQERVLTLDECITIALNNNLDIKQARNNELIAKSNNLQSLMELLPSLNASANYDYFFGTTFDQNAARQVTATTNSSNPNVSANWTLFNGLSTINTRRQRSFEYESAQNLFDDTKLTTEANILLFYLNAVTSQENIKVAEQRVELLTAQLDREEKRESVGVGNLESVYNFRSQLANEQLTLVNSQNQYRRDLLALLQAMQLDPTASQYSVESFSADSTSLLKEEDPFSNVLNQALSYSPALRSAELSQRAARYQLKAARGGRMPQITFLGVWGSNFSSNGARNPDRDPGESGNENFEPDATFWEQMGYNQFEYMNFRINIPIFNRWQVNNNVQVAKLTYANAELSKQQAELTTTNLVQNVYLDLINAQATYRSAYENLESLGQSFDFMQKRFDTGNADFYTYLESLNNKNRAEVQLTNAKYSIVLRKKVLELYRGLTASSANPATSAGG